MTMTGERRRELILATIRELGEVRVVDLAARLDLAPVTLRRDLTALADSGLVGRSHGTVSMLSEHREDRRERVLGMLVPTLGWYYEEVIDGARAAAARLGARLVLGIASYEAADDQAQVDQLLDTGAEGLLLTPNWTFDTASADWIRDLPTPVVLVERRPTRDSPVVDLDWVGSDHEHGVLVALRRFAALGHESVLLAARTDSWTAHDVRTGYAAAGATLGLGTHDPIDITGAGLDRSVAEQIAAHVADGVRAVLVHNDQAAVQLVPQLRAHGLTVPQDIALISYDDLIAELVAPPLTAVSPPRRAVGEAAAETLVRKLRSESEMPTRHLGLLPKLNVRVSCGQPIN
ncbi:substrate-binding domain-containing protein [Actinokineospora sp. HUAS TT18]|uniref:LacI family DNA-binding transcriptional regulator n=1 Tax=Actinokineospora sp. HUAS TT18 TaxID=3447451 RepID=UPI003F51D189